METQTRIYRYTGQSSFKYGNASVALSKFAISGSTKTISKITGITVSWRSYLNTSSTITYSAKLTVGGTTYTSATTSHRGDGDVVTVSVLFTSFPAAASWTESNITLATSALPSSKADKVAWMATSGYPMTITLTYEGVTFTPAIDGAKLYRASSSGSSDNDGQYLSFSAKVRVGNAGTSGSGTFTISRIKSDGTLEVYYTGSSISGSTSWQTLSATPISATKTFGKNEKAYFQLTYTYTAKDANGVSATESISTQVYVSEIFTNVHLAKYSTGGVRFGGYSTATLNNPKFESNFPAYFYNGIVNIQCGKTTHTSHANGTQETVTFNTAYSTEPQVICAIDASGSGAAFGGCFVAVKNVTTSGFTLRYANTSGATRTFAVRWLAYGTI